MGQMGAGAAMGGAKGSMQYFTIQARSNREAIEKMKASYGEEARILTHRNVRVGGVLGLFSREGVEITGYLSEDGGKRKKPDADMEEQKKKILENVRKEQTLQVLLKEIQSIKETLKDAPSRSEERHPGLRRIRDLLLLNDFPTSFIDGLEEQLKKDFSLDSLEDYGALQHAVLEWIGERISVAPPLVFPEKGTKVVVIVGPTGVGKTTTVAKLAAIFGTGISRQTPRRVRIITIDNYRIGAKQQIETYAELMRIPVSLVESAGDLRKTLALYQETDLILVDTIGRSPHDFSKLAEMKECLEACGGESCTYLAVSATTKTTDLEEILRQYEPFRYESVVLTKIDETTRVGNIIGVLAAARKSIAYICDGQGVPLDLEEASVMRLLMNLEGFHVDRERMEKRFGQRRKDLLREARGGERHG